MSRILAARFLAIVVTMITGRSALSSVSASFPGGGGTATVTHVGSDHYTVTLTRTDTGSGTIDALVTGDSDDIIDWIIVETGSASGLTDVVVRGTTPSTATGSLTSMTKTGTGSVALAELRLTSNLGVASSAAIVVDKIDDLIVGGDVLGDVIVVNDSFTELSSVSGDFLGNLFVLSGSVINLPIGGDFGSFSSHSTVEIDGDVINLTANAFYVAMDVGGAIQTMHANGASNTGSLLGSVSASSLAVVSGSTGGFTLTGTLAGDITVTGNVSVPITLQSVGSSGDTIDIGGSLTANLVINSAFSGTIEVGGLAAAMRFHGTPSTSSIIVNNSITSAGSIEFSSFVTSGTPQDITVGADMAGQIIFGTLGAGCDVAGSVSIGQDLTGTISIVRNEFGVGGSLYGAITVDRFLTGRILLGHRLHSTGDIIIGDETNDPALKGQVIIGTAGGGSWDGDVFVNGDELLGPLYGDASCSLGGGAVGVAPFDVYTADCYTNTPDDAYRFRPGSSSHALANPVKISHYGPIQILNTPQVLFRDPYDSGVWGNVSHLFSISVENVPSTTIPRVLRVQYVGTSGVPMQPGHYRVHVQEGDLACLYVGAGDVSVEPYDHDFTVTLDCDSSGTPNAADFLSGSWNPSIDCDRNGVDDDCDLSFDASFRDIDNDNILNTCEVVFCRCDFNGDFALNSQDFFNFLTCYFDIDCEEADWNQDTVVNSQDFFDFLLCFFSGCA